MVAEGGGSNTERLRHPRYELALPVRFWDRESGRLVASGHSVNVSSGDILVRCTGACEVSDGAVVDVGLGVLPGDGEEAAVSFPGRVERVTGSDPVLCCVAVVGDPPMFLRVPQLVGSHPAILAVKEEVLKVAPYEVNVLIRGETGTGKRLLAQAIHAPFVRIHCLSIPSFILEIELFGHEKGAPTDARMARPGLLRLASEGTLLLPEVSALDLDVQAQLLQAIEEKAFTPVGGSKVVSVETRVIATTSEDLQAKMRQGLFRADLYHRLNEAPIHLPPLRDRQSDVVLLAEHFVRKYAAEYGKPYRPLGQEMMSGLLAYPWPGNVQELSYFLRYSLLKGTFRPPREGTRAEAALPPPVGPRVEVERAVIVSALEASGYNKVRAAKLLGIGYRTLLWKLNQFQIVD